MFLQGVNIVVVDPGFNRINRYRICLEKIMEFILTIKWRQGEQIKFNSVLNLVKCCWVLLRKEFLNAMGIVKNVLCKKVTVQFSLFLIKILLNLSN